MGVKEIGNNEDFDNKEFKCLIEECGWDIGQAWCMYFAELVWRKAYKKHDKSYDYELEMLFSAGVMATYSNFRRAGDWSIDESPEVGAIMIMQKYKKGEPTWQGHAGIVIDVRDKDVKTVEGNTNPQGSRDGQEVAQKLRPRDFNIKKNGLVMKGFIHPLQVVTNNPIDALGCYAHDDIAENHLI